MITCFYKTGPEMANFFQMKRKEALKPSKYCLAPSLLPPLFSEEYNGRRILFKVHHMHLYITMSPRIQGMYANKKEKVATVSSFIFIGAAFYLSWRGPPILK
jgi:hypothetical protein